MEKATGKKQFYPKKYIVALDEGTTSARAALFNSKLDFLGAENIEFKQIYPKAGWVEHDPLEIWKAQKNAFSRLLKSKKIGLDEIGALGITNQRETVVVWDAKTGKPVYNAIVWQCRRTADICETLKKSPSFVRYVRRATGLPIDAYFSATKLKWILDNTPDARKRAEQGELKFGTVDSWLIWNLTKGKVHATDYTNASRTMMFNIRTLDWDDKILKALEIPRKMLPVVLPSSGFFGCASALGNVEIPILSAVGDQQSALFGQACMSAGDAKNTYGTGCFMLMNTGENFVESKHGLISTLTAQTKKDAPNYALEGSVFMGGAIIQWLRDELKILKKSSDAGRIAVEAGDSNGVVIVPAFAGLGAPHWDMEARAAIFGLSRGSNFKHIVRASEEAIALQVRDLSNAMLADFPSAKKSAPLRVDGGACADNFLMQFQSDILDAKILRPKCLETTAKGAAMLAINALTPQKNSRKKSVAFEAEKVFSPKMKESVRSAIIAKWNDALRRTFGGLGSR